MLGVKLKQYLFVKFTHTIHNICTGFDKKHMNCGYFVCESVKCSYRGNTVESKTKAHISCADTTQLISAFVLASQTVQSIYFPNPKFHASSHLLWLYSPVWLDQVENPKGRFSHDAALLIHFMQKVQTSLHIYIILPEHLLFSHKI